MAQNNAAQDNAGKPPTQDNAPPLHQADGPSPADQIPQATNIAAAADDQSVGAELLHAALALPLDAIAHVELTLDQLGDTVDLFDVPPFDYGDDFGNVG